MSFSFDANFSSIISITIFVAFIIVSITILQIIKIVDDSNINNIDVLLKKYDRAQTKLFRFNLDIHDQNRVQKKIQIYVNVFSLHFFVFARSLRVVSSDITFRTSRISIKRRFRILIVSKIDEFSRDQQAVMNDDDEKFDVHDDNRSNCIRCCRISIDCRRLANIACDKCFKQKTACISIRFEFVCWCCFILFSQISIRFRIVAHQLFDVRVVLRVDDISLKTFIKKRSILQFYLIVWDRERNDWKDVDEINKKMIWTHEKKLFFMRNIANSLRILVKRKILKMHDFNLCFDE